jgi:uncharacterized membrane protein required for colicin V production
MILDIVIVAFILLLMIIGIKRGIVKTLYGLIIIALAGFLAYLCGKLVAEFIYDNYILTSITDSVSSSFESSKASTGVVSNNIFESIPDFLSNILIGFGVTQRGFASTLSEATEFTQKATLTTVDTVIKPILISAISVFAIIILFILFFILLKLLGRYLLKIFKLPIIKQINGLLGGLLGIVEGLLIIMIFIIISKASASFSNSTFISKELIDSSFLFKYLYYLDLAVLV